MRTADRGRRIGPGSAYVGLVVAALAGYFVYQTWFNPSRAVKRRLGEIAGTLSIPDHEADIARIGRLARLRAYLSPDVHILVDGRPLDGIGAVVGILSSAQAPRGGLDIQFVDVQVAVDSESAAHAGLMLEVNSQDAQTGEWRAGQYETLARLQKRDGEWVVVNGEIRNRPQQ